MDWLTVDIQPLLVAALTIGVVHTLLGPDHYLPFIAIAHEREWGEARTLSITACCGIGHCIGSIVLGLLGVATGMAIGSIEALESLRGTLAAWLLLGFGIAYLCWSLKTVRRNRSHRHRHVHADGTVHTHTHAHQDKHLHAHTSRTTKPLLVALLVVFLLGPCESLIPLLMYPAAKSNFSGLVAVTAVFALATVTTMLLAVFVGLRAARHNGVRASAGIAGAISGAIISLCGLGILLEVSL